MKVDFETNTDGKGLWSVEARMVKITDLKIGFNSHDMYPEDPFFGELRAYFDPSGFNHGTWNVDGYGLIYTDKLWIREFKKQLIAAGFAQRAAQCVKYSEQGMQGDDYVSLDVDERFLPSWKRLNKGK